MQVWPDTNGAWQREHSDFFFTGTRFGLPFVPPISDGTGPLGLIFFMIGFRFPDPAGKRLEQVIKIAQYLFEFLGTRLDTVFSKPFVYLGIDHH